MGGILFIPVSLFSGFRLSRSLFWFFRSGACLVASARYRIALAMVDSTGHFIVDLVYFYLANIICFLYGRVFCAGVCRSWGPTRIGETPRTTKPRRQATATLGIIPSYIFHYSPFYTL